MSSASSASPRENVVGDRGAAQQQQQQQQEEEEPKPAASTGEWAALLAEVDSLMRASADPATEPFRSKYEARRRLLESSPPTPPHDAAAARRAFRLGKIAVDTEAPSAEAEAHLQAACEGFFPDLYAAVEKDEDGKDKEAPAVVPGEALVQAMASPTEAAAIGEEALETLNLLGIVWSGREELRRARAFLLAALDAHGQLTQHLGQAEAAAAETGFRRPLQGAYTHTLFYLAQVYGSLGDATTSASYCYRTLAEELEGEVDLDGLGWVANCLSLVDYHLTAQANDYAAAATCLEACEALLHQQAPASEEEERRDNLSFTRADVDRRWAALYGQLLAAAAELHESGVAPHPSSSSSTLAMAIRFPTLGILGPTASLPAPADVTTYEQARPLFLKASKHLEAAKAYFQLDGFVSDHAHLQRELSRLYRHLSAFEADEKRCAAMYLRRAAALQPLVDELSPEAYRPLHKMLAFELGEIYSALLELKSGRIEGKLEQDPAYRPSKAEAAKCDEYCALAAKAFEHFVGLYQLQQQDRDGASSPYSFEAKEDLGPVLRAHFHLARLRGQLHAYSSLVCVPPQDGHAQRVEAAKASLAAFEWLAGFGAAQVGKWYGEGSGFFGEELRMCAEMARTLPEKINRMHHQHVRFRA